uniref:Uncharacterized protein n=1 Tax=Kalanchoe fedtschenkoi TaxID=63787 RepID=A0A7N0SXW9_KALFE
MSNDSSPRSPYNGSPADHLFRNGILLPHSFPVHQPMCARRSASYRRSASGTSSLCSKDSLMSSRSNSTNSRSSISSCSSSARTSLSDSSSSDRKLFHKNINIMRHYQQKRPVNHHQRPVLDQVYGSSRRWQFMITPMPAKSSQDVISSRPKKLKHGPQEQSKKKIKPWLILRFLRYVLWVCRECHALEPSVRSEISQHRKRI